MDMDSVDNEIHNIFPVQDGHGLAHLTTELDSERYYIAAPLRSASATRSGCIADTVRDSIPDGSPAIAAANVAGAKRKKKKRIACVYRIPS